MMNIRSISILRVRRFNPKTSKQGAYTVHAYAFRLLTRKCVQKMQIPTWNHVL